MVRETGRHRPRVGAYVSPRKTTTDQPLDSEGCGSNPVGGLGNSPLSIPTKPTMTYTDTRVSGHQRQTQYKTVWVNEHTRSTASERAHRPFTGAGHVDMESIRARRTYVAQCKAAGIAY